MRRTTLRPKDNSNSEVAYGQSSLLRFFRWLPFFGRNIRALGAEKILDTENSLLGEGGTYEVWTTYSSQVEQKPPQWQIENDQEDNQWRLVAVKKAKFTISPGDARRLEDPILENGFDVVLRELIIGVFFADHPNIVTPLALGLGILENQVRPYYVMEYAELGTLQSYILKQSVPVTEMRGLCADICQGLRALHLAGIIHGDVKTENALVFPCRLPGRSAVAKLADFGASIMELPDLPAFPYVGTPVLNAPEIRQQSAPQVLYDADDEEAQTSLMRCDVYSFGLLIWETILGGQRFLQSPSFKLAAPSEEQAVSYLNSLDSSQLRARADEDFSTLLLTKPNISDQSDLRLLLEAVHLCLQDEPTDRVSMESLAVMLADTVSKEITADYGWDNTDIQEFLPTFESCGYVQEIIATQTKTNTPAIPWNLQVEIVEALTRAANSSRSSKAIASASYDLAFCYLSGFGVIADASLSLRYMTTATQYMDVLTFIWLSFYEVFGHSSDPNNDQAAVSTILEKCSAFQHLSYGNRFSSSFRQAIRGIRDTFQQCKCLLLDGEDIVIEEFRLNSSSENLLNFISAQRGEGSEALVVPFEGENENVSAEKLEYFLISAGADRELMTLLSNGLDVNGLDSDGETLILKSLQSSNMSLSMYLIDHGADLNVADSMGVTVVHCLIYFELQEARHLAQLFSHKGVDFNSQSKPKLYIETHMTRLVGSPLHWAIYLGYTDLVQLLLEPPYKVDINARNSFSYNGIVHTPLSLATSLNLSKITAELLQRGATHLTGPYPPASHYLLGSPIWIRWLHHGSEYRHALSDTIQAYISHTKGQLWHQLDQEGFCPFIRAVFNAQGSYDGYVIEELLRAGADPHTVTKNGCNSLHWLIYGHRNNAEETKLFRTLMERGVAQDQRAGPDDDTILHYAARFNTAAITDYLLRERGFDVNVRNNRNWTPLHTAMYYDSDLRIGTLLLDHGASVDAEDQDGRTPLGLAIDSSESNLSILQLLLDRNCSLIVDTEQGLSVLQFAVVTPQISPGRRRDFVSFLLRNRRVQSEIDFKMLSTGLTALHIAAQNADLPMVRLLVEAEADIAAVDSDGRTSLDLARIVRTNLISGSSERSRKNVDIEKVIELLEAELV